MKRPSHANRDAARTAVDAFLAEPRWGPGTLWSSDTRQGTHCVKQDKERECRDQTEAHTVELQQLQQQHESKLALLQQTLDHHQAEAERMREEQAKMIVSVHDDYAQQHSTGSLQQLAESLQQRLTTPLLMAQMKEQLQASHSMQQKSSIM